MSLCSSSYKKNGTDIEIELCCSTDNCNTGQASYTGLKCFKGGGNIFSTKYIQPYEYGGGGAYCSVNILIY